MVVQASNVLRDEACLRLVGQHVAIGGVSTKPAGESEIFMRSTFSLPPKKTTRILARKPGQIETDHPDLTHSSK